MLTIYIITMRYLKQNITKLFLPFPWIFSSSQHLIHYSHHHHYLQKMNPPQPPAGIGESGHCRHQLQTPVPHCVLCPHHSLLQPHC